MRLFVSIRKCFDKDSRCPTERKGCGKVDWEQRIVKTELRYHQFVPGGGELRLLSRQMVSSQVSFLLGVLSVCRSETLQAEVRTKRSATFCEASISQAFSTPRLQVELSGEMLCIQEFLGFLDHQQPG